MIKEKTLFVGELQLHQVCQIFGKGGQKDRHILMQQQKPKTSTQTQTYGLIMVMK